MPHAIQIPRLGWSMEQGTFVGWLKQSGDNVQPGEPLFTLEGEKAIQEIEAVDAGLLHFDATNPADGDVVAVAAVIGYLLAVGETAPSIPRVDRTPTSDRPDVGVRTTVTRVAPVVAESRERNVTSIAPPASPAVRRLARQLGIDLSPLSSSGRISEADVCRRYLQSRGELLQNVTESTPLARAVPVSRTSNVPRRSRDLPMISPRAAGTAARLGVDWTRLPGTGSQGRIRERDVLAVAGNTIALPFTISAAAHTISMTPLRRTIAHRMVASLQQTAPVTLTAEIEVTSLIEFREQLKRSGEPLIPSITDAFVKLVAIALQEHPTLNARWRDDAIELLDEVHIGIAVDTNDGLLVPVVRDAHRQSVFEIARQSRDLVEKARARRLTAQDLQGGTFTISNLGSLGIDAFTPIINFPETAVLGLGRIQTRSAVASDNSGTLARRVSEGSEVTGNLDPLLARRASIETASRQQLMTLSLTFDHRVLDGAPAARFLQTLTRLAATDSQSLFEPTSHR